MLVIHIISPHLLPRRASHRGEEHAEGASELEVNNISNFTFLSRWICFELSYQRKGVYNGNEDDEKEELKL